MLVLCGKTASGKDTLAKKLVEKYNYRKIITYTTRPMRENEKQDETYHFVSEKDFKDKIKNNFFAEYKTYNTEFGTWYYGTAIEDLQYGGIDSVIILTPDGLRDVKDKIKDIVSVYVSSNDATIKKRLIKRGDDPHEAERRLQHDNEDFKGIENIVDKVVINNWDSDLSEVLDEIVSFKTKKEIRQIFERMYNEKN